MYAELNEHSSAARFEMRQLDRQAAQAWRFRHHRGAASRMLSTAWSGVKGLVEKGFDAKGPSIAPAHKRLSYWNH